MKPTTAMLLVIFCLASCDDYDEQIALEEHYCEMVDAGAWEAYDDDIDCEVAE